MIRRYRSLGLGLSFAASVAIASSASPPPAAGDWLARAQSEIARREYHASRSGSDLQAPNRAHDLRTYFEPTGVRIHSRTTANPIKSAT